MTYGGASIRGAALAGSAAIMAADKGSAIAGAKAAGKVAAPIAAGVMAVDTARLALNPQARAIAKKTAENRSKGSAAVRITKAAVDPVNTIYGVGAQAAQAGRSWRGAKAAESAYRASKQKFEAKRGSMNATRKAKGLPPLPR